MKLFVVGLQRVCRVNNVLTPRVNMFIRPLSQISLRPEGSINNTLLMGLRGGTSGKELLFNNVLKEQSKVVMETPTNLLSEIDNMKLSFHLETPSLIGPNLNDETLQLDSVLRKRRKKMKKHKLRKRRKRERAMKRKISQGQKK